MKRWLESTFPDGRWQSGGDYLISSPLREDRHPSFAIHPEKRVWHDFATGEHGLLSELCNTLGIEEPGREGRAKALLIPPVDPEARQLWEKGVPASSHAYAERKNVPLDGLRVAPNGDLLIPQRDPRTGEVVGVERILAREPRNKDDKTKFQVNPRGGVFRIGSTDGDQPILISEGVSTGYALHRLTGWPVFVAFSAPQLAAMYQTVRFLHPDREIAVCGDFDEAGRKGAESAAALGATVVQLPEGSQDKDDWLDLEQRHGIEIVKQTFRDQWANRRKKEKPVEPEKPSTAFTLRRIGDIPLTEPEFLVDDLLETDTLALFFGESGCRKTFAVFDIAASIATGAPYAGRQTKEGTVIYLAGEGTGGLPRRARAWEMHREISLKDAPLYTSSRAALFMDEHGAKTVEDEVERIAAESGAPSLIVIDTVARSMVGGDENSAKDTGQFIERVDALRRKYGASCVLVHHNGLTDKGRLRGSSAWKGALDAEFLVSLDGDIVTLTCQKMKEAAEPAPISFRSHEYTVMIGKTGKEITSLALEPTDEKPARMKELSKGLKYALDTYHEAAKEKPELDAEGKFIGVHIESWRPYFYEKSTADSQSGKRSAFNRAIKELTTGGHLTVKHDVYTPVGEADTLLVNEYAKKLNNLTERCSVAERCMSVACDASCEDEALQALHHPKGCNVQRSHATLETGETEEKRDSTLVEKELARQEFLRVYDSGEEFDMVTGRPLAEIKTPPPCGPSQEWLESQPEAVKEYYESELKRLTIIGVGDEEQRALHNAFTKFSEVSA